MRRLTTAEFVEKARAVHGDRYEYSDVEYLNSRTDVKVICPYHGPFWQSPGHHLNRHGCPDCCGGKRFNAHSFIEKARSVHGDRYDYSQVEYVNSKTKVAIICRDHGTFLQTPEKHVWKRGCPDCGGSKPLTTRTFVERAKLVHGDRYDYSQVQYRNSKVKVTIICRDHGPFLQTPSSHLQEEGCPECGGSRPFTTPTFIEKAKALHGERYDYSMVQYVNNRTPVTIICSDHGPFQQRPDGHLRGQGCLECGGRKQLTTESFIENARIVHGDRYDYSDVEYLNSRTKVRIICPDHGSYLQTPNAHVSQGQGCVQCAGLKPLTTQTFVARAKAIHGDRYDYSRVEYVNVSTPVVIICPDHGPFRPKAGNHLFRESGCPDCAGVAPLTTETFIDKAKMIHGDRYDYSSVRYVNAHTKVTIICSDHGPFPQKPNAHLSNMGCPNCAESGFNPNNRGTLYYVAIATDDGDTRYKIGITNTTVERRFTAPDLSRIRVVRTWQYAVGRKAAEREAEILRQYAGDRYYGPDILVGAGNTELFTHDILGLDNDPE